MPLANSRRLLSHSSLFSRLSTYSSPFSFVIKRHYKNSRTKHSKLQKVRKCKWSRIRYCHVLEDNRIQTSRNVWTCHTAVYCQLSGWQLKSFWRRTNFDNHRVDLALCIAVLLTFTSLTHLPIWLSKAPQWHFQGVQPCIQYIQMFLSVSVQTYNTCKCIHPLTSNISWMQGDFLTKLITVSYVLIIEVSIRFWFNIDYQTE